MKQKAFLRIGVYCLAALMLLANVTGVAASPGAVQQAGKVITVSPTGGDYTANIQHAFDLAVAAGPGNTVKLAAGHFTTSFIEVWDFDGTFKGAGQTATVIDTFANQDCQAKVHNNRIPALFDFFRWNVKVSDLSFHITPATPCQTFIYGGLNDPNYKGSWIDVLSIGVSPFIPETDCMAIKKEKVSGALARVSILGEAGVPQNGETDPFFSNLGIPVILGGSGTPNYLWNTGCLYFAKFGQGVFSITDTTMHNAIIGFDVADTYNSVIVISGNTFDNGETGFLLGDNSGSKLEVMNNQIKNVVWSGIWVYHGDSGMQPFLETPSVYDIHNNNIQGYSGGGWVANGIIGWDFDNLGYLAGQNFPSTGKTEVLLIRNNHVSLTDPLNVPETAYLKGIWLEGVDNSLVTLNTVTGTGGVGIIAGTIGPSKRDLILANDLTGYNTLAGSPFTPYKIVLDTGTSKSVVTGEPVANVANYGTDNLIAGTHFLTPGHYNAGDLLKQFLQALKLWKGGFHR